MPIVTAPKKRYIQFGKTINQAFNYPMKNLFSFIFLFFVVTSQAQFSKTHYLPPITAQSSVVEDHYIYISTPNTTNVPFKIIENGGNVIAGVVNNFHIAIL